MPFTGSHPAAVLPFFRPLVPSALVIGSMVPDLGYYVPLPVSSASMHAYLSVADLVLGLLSFAVWQVLVAPVVVAASPAALRRRLTPGPWRAYPVARRALLVIASVWVGAATHVLWDEFTHSGRFGTAHVAWLAERHGPLPGFAWAQYASGIVGAVILAAAAGHWWWTTEPAPSDPVPALPLSSSVGVLLAVALGTLGGAGYAAAHGVVETRGLRHTLFLVASWGGGAGLATLLAACLVVRGTTGRINGA